ncbi:uncharacterized protein LOC120210922 [Hibiscus syriacus]|uniref:uncharacterized protein LOC120210922 n=1 Tax=Hibiscus syriacus TaxID=106335 RepID=UPI001922C3B7|nr:uncharacterized protein LOC120210922 [Hibiscus syriacus]
MASKKCVTRVFLPITGKEWDLMFGSILWSFWPRRNNFIFVSDFIDTEGIFQCGKRLCDESARAPEVMYGGTATCGGAIRDSSGGWIMGFSKALGRCSVLDAELWSVYEGLSVSWDLDTKAAVVETDICEVYDFLCQGKAMEGNYNLIPHLVEIIDQH